MNVVTVGTSLVQLLLYVGGLVVGILLRGRDGTAALLVALGFGVKILGVVVSIADGLVVSAYIRSAALSPARVATEQAITYGFSLVVRVLEIVACLLIFLGLLRLLRRPRAAATEMAR